MTVQELRDEMQHLIDGGYGENEVQVYDADCGWGTITGLTYACPKNQVQLWSDDMGG